MIAKLKIELVHSSRESTEDESNSQETLMAHSRGIEYEITKNVTRQTLIRSNDLSLYLKRSLEAKTKLKITKARFTIYSN